MGALEALTPYLAGAFLALQAWQLHVLVDLKVQVTKLQTKLEALK